MIRPPRLQPGARVAIVAPGSSPPRDELAAGAAILGTRYRLVHDERIFAKQGYLAGPDEDRRAELQRALDDPDLRAIVCARGGYGIMRILSGLDATGFSRAPKPIVGFSDVTALSAWAARLGIATIHGPVVTHLGKIGADDAQALFALLESPSPPPPMALPVSVSAGSAEGRLIAGNLEMLASLIGTPWAWDFSDAILLIEEIGERPYRMDRTLTQLLLTGGFARLRGVVIGDLVSCGGQDDAPRALDVIVERLGTLGIPIAAGAPVGHGSRNRALPIGARARLEVGVGGGTLELLEAAVS